MVEAIEDAVGAALARWTMGAAAAPAAGPWRDALGDDPAEAELRLLALSGHFLGVAVTAAAPADLRILADIPALALPVVPDGPRRLVARLLGASKEASARNELLHFLASRGWTVHPGDWIPVASDEEAPDVYLPWRDWAAGAVAADTGRPRQGGALTSKNWDDFWPAARRLALVELRRRDPGAARALLEAKLASEGAEARLRLLAELAHGLSDADAPFLETIAASDRAPKVKALAGTLLARLGRGQAIGEEVAELAGFFTLQLKGLLRRTRVIEFRNQKTPAQRARRTLLMQDADLASLAAALGLDAESLIAAWPWDQDRQADHALMAMVARTGTDAVVAQAVEVAAQGDAASMIGHSGLAERLPPAARSALAAQLLAGRHGGFELALAIAGHDARLDDPLATPAGAALLAALGRADARPGERGSELRAVGVIASQRGARRAIERLAGAGVLQGDPRLDMLRLSAALNDNGAER